jgi:hypothetical protein
VSRPSDSQAIPGILTAWKQGKSGVVVGSNDNLVDWTYVDNIVHGHLLAAERLGERVPSRAFAERLEAVQHTLQVRDVPTSVRRPDGRWLPFETPVKDGPADPPMPSGRNRLDQFAGMGDPAAEIPESEYAVAGQAFYITNGEPLFFWDFVRAIFWEYARFDNTATVKYLPASLGIVFGWLSQTFAKAIGNKTPAFTVNRVHFMRAHRYHNIDRARLMLGYEPLVGVAEGVKRGVAVRDPRISLADRADPRAVVQGAGGIDGEAMTRGAAVRGDVLAHIAWQSVYTGTTSSSSLAEYPSPIGGLHHPPASLHPGNIAAAATASAGLTLTWPSAHHGRTARKARVAEAERVRGSDRGRSVALAGGDDGLAGDAEPGEAAAHRPGVDGVQRGRGAEHVGLVADVSPGVGIEDVEGPSAAAAAGARRRRGFAAGASARWRGATALIGRAVLTASGRLKGRRDRRRRARARAHVGIGLRSELLEEGVQRI